MVGSVSFNHDQWDQTLRSLQDRGYTTSLQGDQYVVRNRLGIAVGSITPDPSNPNSFSINVSGSRFSARRFASALQEINPGAIASDVQAREPIIPQRPNTYVRDADGYTRLPDRPLVTPDTPRTREPPTTRGVQLGEQRTVTPETLAYFLAAVPESGDYLHFPRTEVTEEGMDPGSHMYHILTSDGQDYAATIFIRPDESAVITFYHNSDSTYLLQALDRVVAAQHSTADDVRDAIVFGMLDPPDTVRAASSEQVPDLPQPSALTDSQYHNLMDNLPQGYESQMDFSSDHDSYIIVDPQGQDVARVTITPNDFNPRNMASASIELLRNDPNIIRQLTQLGALQPQEESGGNRRRATNI
ncbi:MAG: hypothetical protein ABII39_05685, partial [Candidatus Micrarchaeota archaeon]